MALKNSDHNQVLRELQKLPNVGPAIAEDLVLLGVRRVEDLKSRNADEMYSQLCSKTGSRQDPCVWDTFAAVVDYAHTGQPRKWWEFTQERKKRGLKL